MTKQEWGAEVNSKTVTELEIDRWDNNELGNDAEFAEVAQGATEALDEALDEALGMKLISIRLQDGLIQALKAIAEYHGVGYQPMVRDLLSRFAKAELRRIAIKLTEMQERAKTIEVSEDETPASSYFEERNVA